MDSKWQWGGGGFSELTSAFVFTLPVSVDFQTSHIKKFHKIKKPPKNSSKDSDVPLESQRNLRGQILINFLIG